VWQNNDLALFGKVLNVKCRIIMPKTGKIKKDGTLKMMTKYPNFELKLISKEPESGFSVWDKKEVLISTSAVDTPFPFPTIMVKKQGDSCSLSKLF
jgi:hypothetical protein